jgi:putative membrane protein
MSERIKPSGKDFPQRRPATFRLDDPGVVVVDAEETGRPAAGTIRITPETDPALLPVVIEDVLPPRRGFRWGALFWVGVAGLVLMGLGLGVTHLIEDLFARSEGLGFLGGGFAAAAALALIAIIARETYGLVRLATIEKLHRRRQSRRGRRPRQDRAPESPPGAGARGAGGPSRRDHRRRRHDQAGRA